MGWLEWIVLVAALGGLFVLWDLVFCGGRRCKRFGDWIGGPPAGHDDPLD